MRGINKNWYIWLVCGIKIIWRNQIQNKFRNKSQRQSSLGFVFPSTWSFSDNWCETENLVSIQIKTSLRTDYSTNLLRLCQDTSRASNWQNVEEETSAKKSSSENKKVVSWERFASVVISGFLWKFCENIFVNCGIVFMQTNSTHTSTIRCSQNFGRLGRENLMEFHFI